jgi:hypothetical protein
MGVAENYEKIPNDPEGFYRITRICPTWNDIGNNDLCFPPSNDSNKYFLIPYPDWWHDYIKNNRKKEKKRNFVAEELSNRIAADKDYNFFLYPKDYNKSMEILEANPSKFVYVINHPNQFPDFDIRNLQYMNIPNDFCPVVKPCHFSNVCECQESIKTEKKDILDEKNQTLVSDLKHFWNSYKILIIIFIIIILILISYAFYSYYSYYYSSYSYY